MKNKPKCSCYGGFDCEVCNPDYYEEIKTDTPRTDAMYEVYTSEYQRKMLSKDLEQKLAESKDDLIRTQIEMQLEIDKAEAEVERLKEEVTKGARILATIVDALEQAIPWIKETLNPDNK